MSFKQPLVIAVLVAAGFLFAGQGLYNASAAKAYQDSKSDTTTGFPTGSVCKKSGTYRASNKYLENIIVVAEGEIFPPFSDGTKTIWYPRSSSTKNQ
jgi:hypothetical protein